MQEEVNNTLVEEAKAHLRITWSDEDDSVKKLIQRAMNVLRNLIHSSLEFEENEAARQLLFDCCRYIRNNSFEYFQQNFIAEIQTLQAIEMTKEAEQSAES
ncbi:head-tail connector protein [Listeria fleischmannii]|uniref:Gp6 protein n=1 Tax=Listeria fleischmannii FSL S10-1203 TaxID=1265822 RepID=W7DT46_9LIST|nr:head-tail connector protein [Listeria fleischmannii]EUJ56631.1 Gp6 protein [Listeria fleischmannii FSL S10-1203]